MPTNDLCRVLCTFVDYSQTTIRNYTMKLKAFQEYYPPQFSHCFGCGTDNAHGLHIMSYWADEAAGETIAIFTPSEEYTGGFPGFVYGGLIAAILDCHGNATASAAGYRHYGRALGSEPALRYVTANLNLNYRHPTPMGQSLELGAKITTTTDRKVCMNLWLIANGLTTVEGTMTSVLLPLADQQLRSKAFQPPSIPLEE